MIDNIAANKDSIVDDTIETKVSPTTFLSISLLLSIFPTRIAANPNKTVNTKANTAVKTLAKSSSIIHQVCYS